MTVIEPSEFVSPIVEFARSAFGTAPVVSTPDDADTTPSDNPDNVNPANVGDEPVPIPCGVESVTAPEPVTVTWFAVPVTLVMPVLEIVTLPVAPLTEMPVPAIFESTPVFASVIDPLPFVTDTPEPAVTAASVKPEPLPIGS